MKILNLTFELSSDLIWTNSPYSQYFFHLRINVLIVNWNIADPPCDPDNAAGHQADAGLVRAGRVAAHPTALDKAVELVTTFVQQPATATDLW